MYKSADEEIPVVAVLSPTAKQKQMKSVDKASNKSQAYLPPTNLRTPFIRPFFEILCSDVQENH